MTAPLDGLRVVDCSLGPAGPRATGILADYGADVVWIEPPGGDPWRTALPSAASVWGRGKRSVVLDAADDGDRERLLALVDQADVFVESGAPGRADALGLGFEALRARNAALVYCSITGFGADGPLRDVPAHEALVHALVGTMGEQPGHRDGPIFEALPFASIGAAYLSLIGTLAALHRRNEDGWGRHVETSLLDGALAYLSMLWGESEGGGAPMPPRAQGAMRLVTRSFLCGDESYLGIHTGAVGAFGRLMKVLGLDDRIPPSESGLDMGMLLTPEQREILDTEIHDIFASRSRDEWVELLRAADVCAVEHLQPCEAFDKPQSRHNEMVVTVDDPVLGRVEQVAPPAKFSATPARRPSRAPRTGEHQSASCFGPPPELPARASEPDRRPLLEGLRILDLGAYYAGPYTSRLLADLGAGRDQAGAGRRRPAARDRTPLLLGTGGETLDRGKPEGPGARRCGAGLLEWADVVQHNLRPGVAERLGLGYEQARSANPSVVYLYAPGWGSSGPDAMRQSFAPMLSGYAGIGLECAGQFNPPLFPTGNEDPGNGLLGAVATLIALLHRQKTGRGQLVENPQLNATLAHMAHAVRRPDGTVIGANRLDPLQMGFGPFERLYETADGWCASWRSTKPSTEPWGGSATSIQERTKTRSPSRSPTRSLGCRRTTSCDGFARQASPPPLRYPQHACVHERSGEPAHRPRRRCDAPREGNRARARQAGAHLRRARGAAPARAVAGIRYRTHTRTGRILAERIEELARRGVIVLAS